MFFDRFDIIEAHFWFCHDYHGGQWSEEYAKMCRISKYYKPGCNASEPETENGQEIYNQLVEKAGY